MAPHDGSWQTRRITLMTQADEETLQGILDTGSWEPFAVTTTGLGFITYHLRRLAPAS